MRPLDRLTSIKAKLGAVIVIAVTVTVVTVVLGSRSDLSIIARGAIAGSLSLLMVQVMARGMTSPLREMAAAARAMAAGDYGRRVTATSRDEVGELARAFNRMAGELAEVDRMRRDLVANVSHELRTPITALRAVLENLVDGVEPPDPATLQTLLRQVERLGRLVEQLLDLSRLESGAVPLERSVFAVAPFIEQALHEARVAADLAGKTVALTADVEPADVRVEADEERVHQVLGNLLGNAVRHSPPGGCVAVRVRRAPGRLVLEVADEGPGIPPDEANRVFERFYRIDTSRAAADGGTGLGLSIARWVVELHGGDLRVEQNLPTGCRMVVEIPQADR
ncbi:MAG TPA: ATP-binding protein [Mycobacteriales bacterium]|nr:ATP-binding protein [Mycobacteriales bacterium]